MVKGIDAARKLVLENGEVFHGFGFGAQCEAVCELTFSTAMVGYQELVTDPSMMDLMVVMTYPLIGNYGVTDEDNESRLCSIGGMVVREYNDSPSNFRYTKTLSELLEENDVPAISGLDTRALIKRIQHSGIRRAMIARMDTPDDVAMKAISAYRRPADLAARASCRKKWYSRTPNPTFSIVAIDYGVKQTMIRTFGEKGINVTVVPHDTRAEDILSLKPDGLFLSSGPGSPLDLDPHIDTLRQLIGKLPVFGVGLGHFLLAMAYGVKVREQAYVYGGGNHPVMTIAGKDAGRIGTIEIASQSHAYLLDEDGIAPAGLIATHRDLLDQSVQGLESDDGFTFTTDFSPEGAPGPRDNEYLIDRFIRNMSEWRNLNA